VGIFRRRISTFLGNTAGSHGQGVQYAVAHLRRGFARESDGDNLLGMLDRGQQAQVPLYE
jgi:hypothetical protein